MLTGLLTVVDELYNFEGKIGLKLWNIPLDSGACGKLSLRTPIRARPNFINISRGGVTSSLRLRGGIYLSLIHI